jgi:sigma-B regulation protein RsbU (phosphoserine phosphatase)
VINCKTLELQFARAGHPYPIVLHQDGNTASLQSDGGMLGIFPDEQFQLLTMQLSPGDRLLLYSDGFEVAFPNMGEGGITSIANPHYAEELKQLAHGPLDEALERLVGRLDQQAGSLNQRDDLTVVCLGVGVEVPTLSNVELEKLITHALR